MFIVCLFDLDVFYFNMILIREYKRYLFYYYFFKIDIVKFCFKEF